MERRSIVWFRSDLRLHDNEALVEAVKSSDAVFPVYVFDLRTYSGKTRFGFRKTAVHRARFIRDSVADLRKSLEERGLKLIVRAGHPEEVIYELADTLKTTWVFCNRERTHEEVAVQDALEKNLWSIGQEMRFVRGKMLLYTQDLPFPVTHAPDQFAMLRKETEHFVTIRKPLEVPELASVNCPVEEGHIPTLADLGYPERRLIKDVEYFAGGESSGMLRLHQLRERCKSEAHGPEQGETRLSPWISHGCLSPKFIYDQLVAQSDEIYLNCSENLANSLLWRDYYRLIGKKYKHRIFLASGPQSVKMRPLKHDLQSVKPWLEGKTGVPIVDACMTELKLTGYLSHRGRVLVANYLVNEIGANWLIGAEYFESMLLDYDPCSNYGNWNHVAGVGVDYTKEKVTSFSNQEKIMDPDGSYVDHWLSVSNSSQSPSKV